MSFEVASSMIFLTLWLEFESRTTKVLTSSFLKLITVRVELIPNIIS